MPTTGAARQPRARSTSVTVMVSGGSVAAAAAGEGVPKKTRWPT